MSDICTCGRPLDQNLQYLKQLEVGPNMLTLSVGSHFNRPFCLTCTLEIIEYCRYTIRNKLKKGQDDE